MSFSAEAIALLDENSDRVTAARLFEIEFTSSSVRLAESEIEIETLDGRIWKAGFDWIVAAPVVGGDPLEAQPTKYVVGDVDGAMIQKALHNRAEWYDAPIRQFMQLYLDGQPVDLPVQNHEGQIRDIVYKNSEGRHRFEVTAEDVLASRNWSPLGEYTDRDQQTRSPGDRGCEEVAGLANKQMVGWNRA